VTIEDKKLKDITEKQRKMLSDIDRDNESSKDRPSKSCPEIKRVKSSSLKTLIDTFSALVFFFRELSKILIQGLLVSALACLIFGALYFLFKFLYQKEPIDKIFDSIIFIAFTFIFIITFLVAASVNFLGSCFFVKFLTELSKGKIINIKNFMDDYSILQNRFRLLIGIVSTFLIICFVTLYVGTSHILEFLIIWGLLAWSLPMGIRVLLMVLRKRNDG
jgi:hypothetical protein